MTHHVFDLPVLTLLLSLAGCGPKPPAAPEAPVAATPPMSPVAQQVSSAMKTSVDPCVDFYEYACGSWRENTEMPPDRAILTRGFYEIDHRNEALLRTILEEAQASAGDDTRKARVGAFYTACMDEAGIDAKGLAPVQPLLDQVAKVTDRKSLVAAVGNLHESGLAGDPLFTGGVGADLKNPDTLILQVAQGGLGLPDREYYLRADAESAAL